MVRFRCSLYVAGKLNFVKLHLKFRGEALVNVLPRHTGEKLSINGIIVSNVVAFIVVLLTSFYYMRFPINRPPLPLNVCVGGVTAAVENLNGRVLLRTIVLMLRRMLPCHCLWWPSKV